MFELYICVYMYVDRGNLALSGLTKSSCTSASDNQEWLVCRCEGIFARLCRSQACINNACLPWNADKFIIFSLRKCYLWEAGEMSDFAWEHGFLLFFSFLFDFQIRASDLKFSPGGEIFKFKYLIDKFASFSNRKAQRENNFKDMENEGGNFEL